MFNPIIFALTPPLAADVGVKDPQRQTFYGILGGMMGSPIGLGVTLALAAQEGQQNTGKLVPQLSAISPNSGAPGQSVQVTITGANFRVGAQVVSSDAAVAASNVVVVSDKQITATLTIAADAANGTANIIVATVNGNSSALQFGIALTAPVLQSISPATGGPGTTAAVTLTGSSFTPDATIVIAGPASTTSGPLVAVTNPVVASTTQITASLVISPLCPAGNVIVSVKTAGGTSGSVPFAVTVSAPVITSINPPSLPPGKPSPVLITGSGFVPGATLGAGAGAPLSISNATALNATQILATLTPSSAGTAYITVTTPLGTSAPVPFVIASAPTLVSVSPSSIAQGDSQEMILTGTNFANPVTVSFSDSHITANGSPTVVSETEIHLVCAVGDATPTGSASVSVTTPAGTTGPGSFTVDAKGTAAPRLEPALRARERGAGGR